MGRQGESTLGDRESASGTFHRATRIANGLAPLVITLATLGGAAGAQQPGIDGPSKALEGRWRVELYLDKPSARVEPMAGQINGEIGFGTLAWWNPTDRFGRHSLNLRSFFGNAFLRPNVEAFTPADTSMVTEVSGYVRGDSVGIDFIPRVDHGGVSLWGRFWGDSAKGRWYRRGNDGEGHFILRRLSKDPVTVALIPDGRPIVVATAPPPPKKLTRAEQRALDRKEAAAKAKARTDSIALARAEARKQAKAIADSVALAKADALKKAKAIADSTALAKVAARDSAKAVAVAAAKAKQAARDSARAQTLASAVAAKPAAAGATSGAAQPNALAPAATSGAAQPNALAAATTTGDSRTSRGGAATTPVRVASSSASSAALPNATPTGPGTTTPSGSATPAASATADPNAAVPFRVRIFDEASKKYFVTTYSLHLPDGHWMYGKLRTGNGPEGFGPAISRPPGKYEIEIANFMCGDKLWFFKDKILQPVVVAPGTPANVTITVNLPQAPARPSLENKSGEKCTVPIS